MKIDFLPPTRKDEEIRTVRQLLLLSSKSAAYVFRRNQQGGLLPIIMFFSCGCGIRYTAVYLFHLSAEHKICANIVYYPGTTAVLNSGLISVATSGTVQSIQTIVAASLTLLLRGRTTDLCVDLVCVHSQRHVVRPPSLLEVGDTKRSRLSPASIHGDS